MSVFAFHDQAATFGAVPLDRQFITEYMCHASGDDVRVYLLGLCCCLYPQEGMNVEEMTHMLGMEKGEVEKALRYWERRGLVQQKASNPPEYLFLTVNQLMMSGMQPTSDTAYEHFSEAVYEIFGGKRRLHGGELAMCYAWVEEDQLPLEAVLLLLNHLRDTRGQNFSIQSADKFVREMIREKATTLEEAAEYIARDREVYDGTRRVLKRMGKRRAPSKDEENLYRHWLREWGYTPDAIEEACASTTAGDPSFAYLNGILAGMLERGSRAAQSAEEMQQTRDENDALRHAVRRMLKELGVSMQTIPDSMMEIYQGMRGMYPDEVILIAARACGKIGGDISDVEKALKGYRKLGLQTTEDVRLHMAAIERQNELLTALYANWNDKKKTNSADRALLTKWENQLAFDEAALRHAATLVPARVSSPMAYLDKMLTDWAAKGVKTPEQMDAAHAAYRQTAPVQAAAATKVVREQQYTQRPAEENLALKRMLEEMMAEEETDGGQSDPS